MRTHARDSGSASVEFALILPFLLFVLLGIVDFGLAYNTRITLSNAAREGVRVWALGGTQDEAEAAVRDAAVGVNITDVTFDSSPECTFGSTTKLTVTASFTFMTPAISEFVPSFTDLSTVGVMRCGG